MRLTFCGGVRRVTGANYLLESGKKKILFDCGLTQGGEFAEKENYEPFLYDPREIDAVLITHAHIDHIGLLPKLVHHGFQGKIYSTSPTKDLSLPILEDGFKLLLDEAERERKPLLYDAVDLEKVFSFWETISYREEKNIDKNIKFIFRDAGHVLGSAIIELEAVEGRNSKKKTRKIVFSGDLGNPPTPLLCETEIIKSADYILIESTYGNRTHEDKEKRKDILEDVIEKVIGRGGVLMVPAFALERTQELLYELNDLVENHCIPEVPIFIDSPLALLLTEIYKKYPNYYNQEARYLIESGDEIFHFPGLSFKKTVEESKTINNVPSPKVIIAGSGMSNGGRILHHERRYLQNSKNLLLIIAWQAEGSLGRQILDGAKEVMIFGEKIPVRAQVQAIGGYSSHPDKEGLIRWLSAIQKPIRKIFVVHGEEKEGQSLVNNIQDQLGIEALLPKKGDKIELN